MSRGQESIILRAGKLFEAGRVVWKTEGIRHLRQEVLFGEPEEGQGEVLNLDCPSSRYSRSHLRNLELATCTDRNVIEVLHTPFYGHRVAHLHHRSAFFGFQEFYLHGEEEEVPESFPCN